MAERGRWGDKMIMVLHAKDSRRHRKWCDYYREEDGFCYKLFSKCPGSAHCKNYKPIKKPSPVVVQPPVKITPSTTESKSTPFIGIQMISMQDIIMPKHTLHPPAPQKVQALLDYYREHGTLDKPIIVSVAGKKYRLEDKYLRYYVAKKLGLREIPAKIGSKTEMKPEDAIRKKGARLLHKTYGEVVVESSTLKHSVVVDTAGKHITLDIETCISKKLFSVIQ